VKGRVYIRSKITLPRETQLSAKIKLAYRQVNG
jgi:uncharacterized lipoprotein YbaY